MIYRIGDYEVNQLLWTDGKGERHITQRVELGGKTIYHTAFATSLLNNRQDAEELIEFIEQVRSFK